MVENVFRSIALGCAGMMLFPALSEAEVHLPGTQPREHSFEIRDVRNCENCHSRTENSAADPFFSWEGGMMSQAARDPVFRAALAIANQDIKGVGEFCIRCHAPRAWFEGRSTASDGSLLKGDDLHGVSCAVCHHLVDPLSEEGKKLVKEAPPGYGNGMMVLDPKAIRGPYGEAKGLKMHAIVQSPYHATSELCGNCHNVSNPLLATDSLAQPPHAFGHIERTYSEWALSDFAKKDNLQSCQSCHFPRVASGGRAVNYKSGYGDSQRDYFVSHDGVGASTWVQDAIYRIWNGKDLDRDALQAGKERGRRLLKTAAAVGVEALNGTARISITNLTGHKLPTGYPEGRRMWVNIRFLDRASALIEERGGYGEKPDTLNGRPVRVPTILAPQNARIYECKPGISAGQAAKYGKQAGPSFHFILNDVITKDNRIPPRGFSKSSFEPHLAAPVGVDYEDGQYWDTFEVRLPREVATIEIRLMYQSVSWEYLKFLVEENRTDDWSRKLYEAWESTGKCAPEEIAFVKKTIQP